jgi:D-aminopeptidase
MAAEEYVDCKICLFVSYHQKSSEEKYTFQSIQEEYLRNVWITIQLT